MKTEIWLAFIFGVVFLLISLAFAVVAFYLPKPANPAVVENFLYVMQVVLAISASGVAAVIPGFLNVNVQKKLGDKGTLGIRAGGAIAVFVLVFVISPKTIALDQVNQRVGFNELLEKCRSFIPVDRAPASGAIRYCLDAGDFDPKRWEAYRQLARLYFWNGQYKESIENYQKSISLMVDKDFEKITEASQIKKEFSTEFFLANYGIAMAYVGLANTNSTDIKDKVDNYQKSLSTLEKCRWFVTKAIGPRDQSLNDIVYLEALNRAYIWLTDDVLGVRMVEFDTAVEKFQQFLKMPDAVPQWAEYHLSCLYSEAANRFKAGIDGHKSEARAAIVRALNDLLSAQYEKSIVQRKLMQCRLLNPAVCQKPRGSEPMICLSVAKLVAGDSEILSLVAKL